MGDLAKKKAKNATLQDQLVTYVQQRSCGRWLLGALIVRNVHALLEAADVHTTQETLSKELRAAVRAGRLAKCKDEKRMVLYRPVGAASGLYPQAKASTGGPKQTSLLCDDQPQHFQRG